MLIIRTIFDKGFPIIRAHLLSEQGAKKDEKSEIFYEREKGSASWCCQGSSTRLKDHILFNYSVTGIKVSLEVYQTSAE